MSGETEAKPARKLSVEERRAAREERRKSKEAEKARKAAELEALLDEQMEDVEDIREAMEDKGEDSELLVYRTDYGVIAARKPKPAAVSRFRAEMNKQGKKKDVVNATNVLVLDSLVYPSRDQYQAIVAKLPLIPEAVGHDLYNLAGANLEPEVKKS